MNCTDSGETLYVKQAVLSWLVCDMDWLQLDLRLQAFAAVADIVCEDRQSKARKVCYTMYWCHMPLQRRHL